MSYQRTDFQERLSKLDRLDCVELTDHLAHVGSNDRQLNRRVRKDILGYPLAVIIGLALGYVALVLIFVFFPPQTGLVAPQNMVYVMVSSALTFGLGASFGPALAIMGMILIGYRELNFLFVAGLFGYLSYHTSQVLVDFCNQVILIAPPAWLVHAASNL